MWEFRFGLRTIKTVKSIGCYLNENRDQIEG